MTKKNTYEYLRESEEIFRLMVEALQDYAIFILDPDGYVSTWNGGAERITGYTAKEILGNHFAAFYAPDDCGDEKPAHELKIAAKTGKYEEEGWRIRKDGSRFMAHVLISSVKDPAGNIKWFTFVTRDITARCRAEERVRESEEEIRLMIDAVQDYAIFMLDPQGRVVNWSSGAQKIKGYSAQEVLGAHFSRFYTETDRKAGKPEEQLRKATENGRAEDEGWRVRKDGSLFWANAVITGLRDESGYLRGFCKVTREVRSRVEELWRRVIYSAPHALIMVNPIGEIALVNSQAEKLFQYTQNHLLGKEIAILFPPEFQERFESRAFFYGNGHEPPLGGDVCGLRQDGSEVPVEIGLNPIQMPEGIFTLASIVDLTERKHIEKKLAAMNEDLEQKVKERTTLAEQRALKLQELASILTLTEQRERGRLAQILHDNLQQMLVASKIGLSRLNDYVASNPAAKASVFQVEKLLEESIDASRKLTVELSPPVLRDAGIVPAFNWLARWVKENHGLDVQVQVFGMIQNPSEERKLLLFQSIRELLLNVVKHSGTGKAIIKINAQKGDLQIAVEDEGKGFDCTKLTSHDSTHFGLFNVRERLEMLSCTFKVESEIGHGTRIFISAPCENKKAASYEILPPFLGEGPGAQPSILTRVLVADDHKILRQGLIHALKSCPNIKVVGEAENGQEAVGKALALEPDVIIMDITMPKMNGIEATRRINQFNPQIKIIGLSLHEAEDMEMTMRKAGASIYLNKSGPIDALIAAIRAVMDEVPALEKGAS